MADPLSSVTPGQPLEVRAATWNAVLAAARDRRQKPRPGVAFRPSAQTGCVEALGYNDTGADLPAFKPAKVGGSGPYTLHSASEWAARDWSGRPVVSLEVPTRATDIIAVTLDAIPSGQFGRVAVGGWCACDVTVTDATHEYARPGVTTDQLASAASGPVRIVNTGTGTTRRTQAYLFLPTPVTATPERIPFDLCVIKNGSGYVTDVIVTYLNSDGTTTCETAAECTDDTCAVAWWCTTIGVVSYPIGSAPPSDEVYSGPYRTYDEAVADCNAGGPGEPAGGTVTCCTPSQQLNSVLYAALDGGNGTVTLTWDGVDWVGSKALACGETVYIKFGVTCSAGYSCNGSTYASITLAAAPSNPVCGPPFSYEFTSAPMDLNSGSNGCNTPGCGTVNITSISE